MANESKECGGKWASNIDIEIKPHYSIFEVICVEIHEKMNNYCYCCIDDY